jgi:hypothetical protein
MSQIRFATARDVFDSFVVAPRTISVPPTDELPLDFLRGLVAKGKLEDALAFCGYLLPRREAVWWGCRSARMLLGDAVKNDAQGLTIAETWVGDPNVEHRRAADEFGKTADKDQPLTWLALAAAWSGGTLSMEGAPAIAPPPELSGHAVRVAILLSARHLAPAERNTKLAACVDDAARLAETGL